MNQITHTEPTSVEEYKKMIELLRVRLNVLNATIFLLEENLPNPNLASTNYIKKINTELETIRKIVLPNQIDKSNSN